MKNCKSFKDYWNSKKNILRAIVKNIIVLLILLLVFEPTPKSDDYDQVMILNGAFTGKYSSYLPYCNYFFSKFNQILYTLFPNIPWYYVVQYVFIFLSLTLIMTIFEEKEKNDKRYRDFIVFVILLLCGYELYIRFTFTKVAGIAIISGFIALLDLILKEQKKTIKYFFSCVLILIGMTIRDGMYLLVVEVFASSFFIFMIEAKKNNKNKLNQMAMFIFFVILLYICSIGLSKYHVYMVGQDKVWKEWFQVNSARARLQDYDMADFETYKKEYSSIGMSYNDYCTWKNHAIYADKEYFTPDLLKKIADIKPIQTEKSIIKILIVSFHNSLSYYLKDTGIYIFLIAAVLLFLCGSKDSLKYIIIIFLFCFLAYLYMDYRGRLQHHVDICVLMAGAFLLLYYSYRFESTTSQWDVKGIILISNIVILFVTLFYNGISSSSYYANLYGDVSSKKERQQKNKETLDILSEDKSHYYLFAALDTNYIYDDVWGMFQKVKLGYYSNLGICNRYYFPNFELTLENYEINNIMKESINSDVIRFASTVHNPDYINVVTTYIREHYNERVYSILVKQVGEVSVYSIVTQE